AVPASASPRDTFSYPRPIILPRTLRFSYASVGTESAELIAQSNFLSQSIEFDADNILPRADILRVFYGPVSPPRHFSSPLETQQTTFSSIVCSTQEQQLGFTFLLDMVFTVDAGGQSAQGTDVYRLPRPPHITWVRGCSVNSGNGTSGCLTAGGETISICGS